MPKKLKKLEPILQRHSCWSLIVGASVALNDLDGNGLPNDVCYVDTKTDGVIVPPVLGKDAEKNTGSRYQPLVLEKTADLYASSTMASMGCLPRYLNEN